MTSSEPRGPRPAGGWQPWDPAAAWPAGRKWIWAFLAAFLVIAQGPPFLRSLRTNWETGNDFFQDWASARQVLEGRPAYLPLSDAVSRYVPKVEGRSPVVAHLPWNAHPPSSVLAIMPLALLDYPEAGTLWNLLGLLALIAALGLILRELEVPVPAWSILPIMALGLLCGPARTQFAQGQWDAPLLLLLTLAWVADRRGRSLASGLWIGTAGVLKLFPLFFFLYFAVRRRWHAVIAGALGMIALSLLTAAILGPEAYRDYYHHVLPTLREFRSSWDNASVQAFWTKNFSEGASHYGLFTPPVIRSPSLAVAGIVLSYAAVLGATFLHVNRSRSISVARSRYGDLCYSLTLVSMLWLAPICWDHYLLLVALPLLLVWMGLGPSGLERLAFLLLVGAIWVSPDELWRMGGINVLASWPDFQDVPPRTYLISRPMFVPVFLSLHFYTLLALYLWLLTLARREFDAFRDRAVAGRGPDGSPVSRTQ